MKASDLVSLRKKNLSKYKNKKTIYQGWIFDSQLECDFYKHLQTLKEAGKVEIFLHQVPLRLAPKCRLVIDFLVKYSDDPLLYFLDTKGYMTQIAKTKIKMAEHLYGIQIGIIKRGDF